MANIVAEIVFAMFTIDVSFYLDNRTFLEGLKSVVKWQGCVSGNSDNYILGNPLVTPPHIVPE